MPIETPWIYKILTDDQWSMMQLDGQLVGAPIDIADGYIHFSTANQLSETLAKHFAGQAGLQLLQVAAENCGSDLKWEVSRNEELFPHLYASLPLEWVNADWPLALKDGVHQLPDLQGVG